MTHKYFFKMNKILIFTVALFATNFLNAQNDTISKKIPFENYNTTWMNGQNRQKDFPLVLKDKSGETILTGVVYLDGHFNYNFAQPKDNTQTISAVTARSNEFSLALASIGIESNYKNTIGRLWLQTGSMLNIIQETDGSVNRGRNTSTGNLKFIREAAAGYHFDVNYGLNVEMGIFMSYIGLESYLTQENWSYQRSMVAILRLFIFKVRAYNIIQPKTIKQNFGF